MGLAMVGFYMECIKSGSVLATALTKSVITMW